MDADDRPHRIEADPDQLQPATLNLVKNALAGTPCGGTSTVLLVAGAAIVRLVVRETGSGTPPENQERLFEPFFMTRAAEGGTGLGLAVVRAIATEHGARVAVSSRPGKGVEF